MRLKEKHKEFVVQGYARFMTRSQIVDAFLEEFNDEIYQLCTTHNASGNIKAASKRIEERFEKQGIPANKAQLDAYIHSFCIGKIGMIEVDRNFREEIRIKQNLAKAQLSANFRRLNITHPQFPEKYRALFNQTREEYLANYRSASLSIPENVILQLETLYELTKELAFEKRDLKYIAQATQLLKTIAACNAVNAQSQTVDVTPQDVKALQNTQKNLANQLKKETRQLAKSVEEKDA